MRKWRVELEVGGDVDDVARASVRWPVPTRACVAGNGGVRSLGAETEATLDPSGGVGEGKAGRVNVSEPPIASRQGEPRVDGCATGVQGWLL